MPVDVRDLPPAYQAQALRKLMEQEPGPLFRVDEGTGEIIGEGAEA